MIGEYRAQAVAIVEKLEAAGVRATTDPRSATPPCVLVPPPERNYTEGAMCGPLVLWQLWALAPGASNADAWDALDALEAAIAGAVPLERTVPTAYTLSPESSPLPAYRCEFTG